jgi:long-chain fatty acid transport protein
MGRASAGAVSGVDDASATLYNPASMTRLKNNQIMMVVGVVNANTEFSIDQALPILGNDDGGDAASVSPVAGLNYVRSISDELWFGFTVAGLTGAALDYGDNWVGKSQTQQVELLGLAIAPSLGYKVNDRLSVGFSVQLMYTELDMEVGLPIPGSKVRLDGDDTIFSFKVGTMYELSQDTRIGLTYQHEFEPEYGGKLKFNPGDEAVDVGVETSLTLATRINLGLSHQLNDQMGLHFSLGWEKWSSMDKVIISVNSGGAALDRNWDDTWHYAVGIDYRLDSGWVLNLGLGYDTNPVSAVDRTADMPIDRQVRYAFGLTRDWSETLTLNGNFVYADYGSAAIRATGFSGDYKKNELFFLMFSANWKI